MIKFKEMSKGSVTFMVAIVIVVGILGANVIHLSSELNSCKQTIHELQQVNQLTNENMDKLSESVNDISKDVKKMSESLTK